MDEEQAKLELRAVEREHYAAASKLRRLIHRPPQGFAGRVTARLRQHTPSLAGLPPDAAEPSPAATSDAPPLDSNVRLLQEQLGALAGRALPSRSFSERTARSAAARMTRLAQEGEGLEAASSAPVPGRRRMSQSAVLSGARSLRQRRDGPAATMARALPHMATSLGTAVLMVAVLFIAWGGNDAGRSSPDSTADALGDAAIETAGNPAPVSRAAAGLQRDGLSADGESHAREGDSFAPVYLESAVVRDRKELQGIPHWVVANGGGVHGVREGTLLRWVSVEDGAAGTLLVVGVSPYHCHAVLVDGDRSRIRIGVRVDASHPTRPIEEAAAARRQRVQNRGALHGLGLLLREETAGAVVDEMMPRYWWPDDVAPVATRAELLGLKRADVITSLMGQAVTSIDDVNAILAATPVDGQPLRCTVLRDGRAIDLHEAAAGR